MIFFDLLNPEMDYFLKTPGKKVELGRACIDPLHRNGNVIDLLWKGIGKYILKTDSQYLFGCSSVHITNKKIAWKIFDYMQEKEWVNQEHQIAPIGKFQFKRQDSQFDIAEMKQFVPSLLKSYIAAGARVCAAPAYDKDFHCMDYLTVLDVKNISRLFKKRKLQIY